MARSFHGELERALRACRGAFLSVFTFSFFINLLMFIAPLYMLNVYDRVLTSRSVPTLISLTLVAGGMLVVMGVLETVRSRVLVRTGAWLDNRIGERLFSAVFRRSVVAPGGSQAQSLRDLDQVREFLTGQGLLAFIDAPWVPLFLTAVFLLHPILGAVATLGAVIIFALALTNALWSRKPLKDANQASINANNYVTTSVRNAEAMEAMGMMPGIVRRWKDRHRKVLALQAQASDRAGTIVAISKSVRMFLQVAILGTGAYLAIQQIISPGVMIAASILMGRALAPVEQAVAQWRSFVNARAAYERLRGLLAATPVDEDRMALPAPEGHLSIERVVAGPPESRSVILKGVSFEVRPGEVLGVIGPSAAGKSTLARVLVGVWPTLQGCVRLDGANMAHWDKQALGPHIGYLPQDVELFDGSVAENIARFNEIEPAAVVQAAQRAGVHDMILSLPEGYDTQIGAGGAVLSGGQRQRVALARALYNEPQLLVLDEPNANLDSEGETALMHALNTLRETGKTVIVITHRPTLLNAVDTILVLKGGMIDAIGPRAEILAKVMQPKAVADSGRVAVPHRGSVEGAGAGAGAGGRSA